MDYVGNGEWRVGGLAKATGLTVRTLHYYDSIGLLCPSRRTVGGHRIYSETDVQRLYQISLLRRFGLPLDDISRTLDDPNWSLSRALSRHVEELDREIALSGRLRQQVTAMLAGFDEHGEQSDAYPDTADLVKMMEDMTMMDTNLQRRISILVYEDIEAAHDYLIRVFGLGAGAVERDDSGTVMHAEVQAGDGMIWLHRVAPEHGLASPKTLGAGTGMTVVMVDDVDAHHARVQANTGEAVAGPVDQPYGYREYTVAGPEGELWSFMTPLG